MFLHLLILTFAHSPHAALIADRQGLSHSGIEWLPHSNSEHQQSALDMLLHLLIFSFSHLLIHHTPA